MAVLTFLLMKIWIEQSYKDNETILSYIIFKSSLCQALCEVREIQCRKAQMWLPPTQHYRKAKMLLLASNCQLALRFMFVFCFSNLICFTLCSSAASCKLHNYKAQYQYCFWFWSVYPNYWVISELQRCNRIYLYSFKYIFQCFKK